MTLRLRGTRRSWEQLLQQRRLANSWHCGRGKSALLACRSSSAASASALATGGLGWAWGHGFSVLAALCGPSYEDAPRPSRQWIVSTTGPRSARARATGTHTAPVFALTQSFPQSASSAHSPTQVTLARPSLAPRWLLDIRFPTEWCRQAPEARGSPATK